MSYRRNNLLVLVLRRPVQITRDAVTVSVQRAIHPFAVIECRLFASPPSIYLFSLSL